LAPDLSGPVLAAFQALSSASGSEWVEADRQLRPWLEARAELRIRDPAMAVLVAQQVLVDMQARSPREFAAAEALEQWLEVRVVQTAALFTGATASPHGPRNEARPESRPKWLGLVLGLPFLYPVKHRRSLSLLAGATGAVAAATGLAAVIITGTISFNGYGIVVSSPPSIHLPIGVPFAAPTPTGQASGSRGPVVRQGKQPGVGGTSVLPELSSGGHPKPSAASPALVSRPIPQPEAPLAPSVPASPPRPAGPTGPVVRPSPPVFHLGSPPSCRSRAPHPPAATPPPLGHPKTWGPRSDDSSYPGAPRHFGSRCAPGPARPPGPPSPPPGPLGSPHPPSPPSPLPGAPGSPHPPAPTSPASSPTKCACPPVPPNPAAHPDPISQPSPQHSPSPFISPRAPVAISLSQQQSSAPVSGLSAHPRQGGDRHQAPDNGLAHNRAPVPAGDSAQGGSLTTSSEPGLVPAREERR